MIFSGLFGAFGFNLDSQMLRTEFPPGTLFFFEPVGLFVAIQVPYRL